LVVPVAVILKGKDDWIFRGYKGSVSNGLDNILEKNVKKDKSIKSTSFY
jgi:hypothetical protein